MKRLAPFLLLLATALGGCDDGGRDAPVTVSVIGDAPALRDPNRVALAPADAVLLAAVAQGLVGFDSGGQVEPGLAERWIVADEGRSFIFRLPAGAPDARAVARRLRAMLGGRSRNPLKPLFGAVEEVVAVTPQVIEIRLSTPRPELLQLLAQPELAYLRDGRGAGPLHVLSASEGVLRLSGADHMDDGPTASPVLRLRGEPAARAVARFVEGGSQLVLGGTMIDLPLARAADQRRALLRFDPVDGLFGLAFSRTDGFFGDPEIRRALDMALDREALAGALALPGWVPRTTLRPSTGLGMPAPQPPDWTASPLAQRRAAAAATIAAWVERNGAPPPALVALPEGPAARLLLNRLALDWQPIGVFPILARKGERPALHLLDEVAPVDAPAWYLLRFACARGVPCTADSDRALTLAERAPSLAERIILLREAERLMAQTVPFLPLGAPVRWSLVAPRLDGFQESPRGWHPLHLLVRVGR